MQKSSLLIRSRFLIELIVCRRQIREDIDLMVTSCPNLRKVNIVVHYKNAIMDDTHSQVTTVLASQKPQFLKGFFSGAFSSQLYRRMLTFKRFLVFVRILG